jgi:uncharacterized membrane protein YccC
VGIDIPYPLDLNSFSLMVPNTNPRLMHESPYSQGGMPRMDLFENLRKRNVLRSAIRFAVAIVVADALVWLLFREGTPVVMGSFAVICLLYFLDYDGSTTERLAGYIVAASVGVAAVVLGSVLAGALWVAVLGAFVISFSFAYARVLKGYVARASVGLQGAFFLPLMADVPLSDLPSMVGSWLVGSAVAISAGLAILPNRRSGVILDLMTRWLGIARDVTVARSSRQSTLETSRELAEVGHQLWNRSRDPVGALGVVGRRDRALSYMVDGTQWGTVAFDRLDDAMTSDQPIPIETRTLLDESAEAFDKAEAALAEPQPPRDVPDLAQSRRRDLRDLTSFTDAELIQHYPARLVSILAMRMLWLAGRVRGVSYPDPDLGSVADRSPWSLLTLNFGWRSVWFVNAIRTGASTAVCVLLVRELGLDHGLWVVLAALSVTQVSFSASANGYSSLRLALGAMSGVAVASVAAILSPPHVVFVALLPILAFAAVVASRRGPFLAQTVYTPFALTNLAAIQWTTDRDLEIARIENISLGVAVAAAFALMVFPFGLVRQLVRQVGEVDDSSRAYLLAAIGSAKGGTEPEIFAVRARCVRSVSELEATLSASAVRSTLSAEQVRNGHSTDVIGRDRLIGGDACLDLGRQRSESPELGHVADVFASWWETSALLTEVGTSNEKEMD